MEPMVTVNLTDMMYHTVLDALNDRREQVEDFINNDFSLDEDSLVELYHSLTCLQVTINNITDADKR